MFGYHRSFDKPAYNVKLEPLPPIIPRRVVEISEVTSGFNLGPRITDRHALKLSLIPSHSNVGCDSSRSSVHICASIKAMDLPNYDDKNRAPVDIVVALDVSGSMTGSKLQLSKITLEQLLALLNPQDRFGLICYNNTARAVFPPQEMSETNKRRALDSISFLHASGGTNITSAIDLAAQEMLSICNPNPVQSIFLLTDGQANEGIRSETEMVEHTQCCLARCSSTCSIHCFGYGSQHDSKLLSQMAESTMGSYYFIEDDRSVIRAFGIALGGVFSVVAQNVTISFQVPIEASSMGVSVTEVMHESTGKCENDSLSISVGDLFAEESRDVLLNVKLAVPFQSTTSFQGPIPHLQAILSYTDTIRNRLVNQRPQVCSVSRPKGCDVSPQNDHVSIQLLRLSALTAMHEAQEFAKVGDLDSCRRSLREIPAWVGRMNTACQNNPLAVTILGYAEEVEEGVADISAYKERGHGRLVGAAHVLSCQRIAGAVDLEVSKRKGKGNAFSTSRARLVESRLLSLTNDQAAVVDKEGRRSVESRLKQSAVIPLTDDLVTLVDKDRRRAWSPASVQQEELDSDDGNAWLIEHFARSDGDFPENNPRPWRRRVRIARGRRGSQC